MFLPMLGIGVLGVAGVICLGALVSLARAASLSTLTFTSAGIHEEISGTPPIVVDRPWSFLTEVVALPSHVTLYCAEPLRSGRLAAAANRRHIVVDRSHPELDTLRALVEANTPHRF